MVITDVIVYEVRPRWIFIRVNTDVGISGWGEMLSLTRPETVVAGARELGARIIGRNPFEIERLWQEMYKSFFRGGPIYGTIVSGLEIALWDIKGKALGVPVYELLGGKARDRIQVYSWIGGDRPSAVVQAAKERYERDIFISHRYAAQGLHRGGAARLRGRGLFENGRSPVQDLSR